MRKIVGTISLFLLMAGSGFAASNNLFASPFILVTPRKLDFGTVPLGKTATNTFVIENIGSGRLAGSATVPGPFKIVSGGEYSLKYGSAQIVTITYTPTGAGTDAQTVKFTGGFGAKVAVVGKMAPLRPNQLPPANAR